MSDHPAVIQWHRRVGRFQFRLTVYRHRYFRSADRWVFQPQLTYDRKRGSSDE